MRRRVLRLLDRVAPWAAWGLLVGALIVFVGVVANLIATGTAKWATLLIAAELVVSGYSEVRDETEDEG